MEGVMQVGGQKVTVHQECIVRFECPRCNGLIERDAFLGPVFHKPCWVLMTPEALIHAPRDRAVRNIP